MDRRRLEKLKRELEDLQASPRGVRGSELIRLAEKLGRRRNTKRGKEPTWEREPLMPGMPAFPLTIPGHSGDLKIGTAKSIINALLEDVDEHEQLLDQQESSNGPNTEDYE